MGAQDGAVFPSTGAAPLSFNRARQDRATTHTRRITCHAPSTKSRCWAGWEPTRRCSTPPGGTAVTKLRLATDRYRKDAENETDWHDVVCWSNTAEAVNQYVGKGQRVYVEGRLVQNSWEGDDGQRRHRTEIHASEVVFLDSKGGNGTGDAADIEQPVGASPF